MRQLSITFFYQACAIANELTNLRDNVNSKLEKTIDDFNRTLEHRS